MTSLPLYSTPGRTTSGVACHYRLWAAHTIEQRRAGHAIIAHGRQTCSNDIWRDMPSPPLDNTHGRTKSGMACHRCLWESHTVEQHRAWHDITTLRLHTRSDNVGHGMPSSPLGSTHDRTTSGVVCHHRLWAAQMVERRWAWHDITALGQHTRSATLGVE